MSNKAYFIALSMSVLLLAAGFAPELWGVEADMPELLLDDFSSDVSTIGTRWDGFTDRVMGGVSDMRLGIAREAGIPYLSMSGNVSLANRGGFIQARLMLEENGRRHFDASAYRGIRVVVRGEGDGYYLFLRTASMVFPWAFYMASIPVTGEWQEVRIPWSAFEKGDFGTASPLDLRRLRSVAVTAYKKEFTADLAVREIGLY